VPGTLKGEVIFPSFLSSTIFYNNKSALANGLWSQRLQQLVAQVSDDTSVEPELRTLIAAVGCLHYWVLVVERCRQAAQNRLATRIAPLSAKGALLALMNSMVPLDRPAMGRAERHAH
jgi:hypothetical protein